jgi:hypothetical protein
MVASSPRLKILLALGWVVGTISLKEHIRGMLIRLLVFGRDPDISTQLASPESIGIVWPPFL